MPVVEACELTDARLGSPRLLVNDEARRQYCPGYENTGYRKFGWMRHLDLTVFLLCIHDDTKMRNEGNVNNRCVHHSK